MGRAGRAPSDGRYGPPETWERRYELLLALPLYVAVHGGAARAAARLGVVPRIVKRWCQRARALAATGTATNDGVEIRVKGRGASALRDPSIRAVLARFVDRVRGERGAA